jgi:hypothetical protein
VHASNGSLAPHAPIGIASEPYAELARRSVPPPNSSALQMVAAPFPLFQKE